MKAITLQQNGGVENLVVTELPAPKIQPHEVLIQVRAIGINPVDSFIRQNSQYLQRIINPREGETIILGWDVSGIVTEVGHAVSSFKKGDAVFGMVNFAGAGKAYAEYVAAPSDQLALKPANITHIEAAGATLAALTAWQALVTYAKVKKGDKVLIHAAAGGVGHYAVQIAKHLGAYVIGTGSTGSKEFILGLGADAFIDYNSQRFENEVTDADVVLDSLPGDHVLRSIAATKRDGRVISLLTFFEGAIAEKAAEKNLFAHRLFVTSNGEDMKSIAALLEKGVLRSHISQTYPFEQMRKAHQQIESGKTRGKIVVEGV